MLAAYQARLTVSRQFFRVPSSRMGAASAFSSEVVSTKATPSSAYSGSMSGTKLPQSPALRTETAVARYASTGRRISDGTLAQSTSGCRYMRAPGGIKSGTSCPASTEAFHFRKAARTFSTYFDACVDSSMSTKASISASLISDGEVFCCAQKLANRRRIAAWLVS